MCCKRLLTLLTACFAMNVATAALAPEVQESKEIESIKAHEEFQKLLDNDPGEYEIHQTEDGYQVHTPHLVMNVHVVYDYEENEQVGPAQYHLEFETPQTKDAE